LQRVIELQKLAMEGQKNALKMEIHYNRDNAKQVINTIHNNDYKSELNNQFSKIINLMESNNKLMETNIRSMVDAHKSQSLGRKTTFPILKKKIRLVPQPLLFRRKNRLRYPKLVLWMDKRVRRTLKVSH
jgi:hypothetical protein